MADLDDLDARLTTVENTPDDLAGQSRPGVGTPTATCYDAPAGAVRS
ncbi:hypothetical protein GII33_01935 [Gordonia pseudamarae]|jgi:hypothetical protein|uniref:Uncharacterized protein n=1 Tax=Gordonia pseudamarae TaxID=2831662 RepID=A0ABX6IDF6_9ACTN|nr:MULTISPECIES: hypothetical protein [Gordonia]MBD0022056.1 hypothetical protein [Gordonia sp. (in: high G+C Gram-positive bacteria)]QHN24911.1 hypothetical protein GII33_01935 [Gordonia pseudamarae]QHN33844.1 hypothetical protein GII31_01930 [Gordonia pseudamarae]